MYACVQPDVRASSIPFNQASEASTQGDEKRDEFVDQSKAQSDEEFIRYSESQRNIKNVCVRCWVEIVLL